MVPKVQLVQLEIMVLTVSTVPKVHLVYKALLELMVIKDLLVHKVQLV